MPTSSTAFDTPTSRSVQPGQGGTTDIGAGQLDPWKDRSHLKSGPDKGKRIIHPKYSTCHLQSIDLAKNQFMGKGILAKGVESHNVPLHNATKSQYTAKPRALLEKSLCASERPAASGT
jgi:hypothetical protein